MPAAITVISLRMRTLPVRLLDLAAALEEAEVDVGQNEPCPCGSGKKFKHCHGSLGRDQ